MPKAHFFADMKEALGTDTFECEAATVKEFTRKMEKHFGTRARKLWKKNKIIVGGKNIGLNKGLSTPLRPEDDVYFIPPAAGG